MLHPKDKEIAYSHFLYFFSNKNRIANEKILANLLQ